MPVMSKFVNQKGGRKKKAKKRNVNSGACGRIAYKVFFTNATR